ncbi:MAG: hypothetical protein CL681_02330 [Blastopirellula sp.]|nr:hypothetical protein [Blastopirellula sp.]
MIFHKLSLQKFPRRSVYCLLSGGLGNQMFQYATARALALSHNAVLYLDIRSRFINDLIYNRTFMLSQFPIIGLTSAPFWIHLSYKILKFFQKLRGCLEVLFVAIPWLPCSTTISSAGIVKTNLFGAELFQERDFFFHPELVSSIKSLRILSGYWQSPAYFLEFSSQIRAELFPPTPTNTEILRLGAHFRDNQTLAIGVRLYEESPDSWKNAHKGRQKSLLSLSKVVSRFKSDNPGLVTAVFCTHHSPLINQYLDVDNMTHLVFPEYGFSDPVDTMWLLSQCKHHIFLNSSFYWWGAWLSSGVHPLDSDNPSLVCAADNFINQDSYVPEWCRF